MELFAACIVSRSFALAGCISHIMEDTTTHGALFTVFTEMILLCEQSKCTPAKFALAAVSHLVSQNHLKLTGECPLSAVRVLLFI